MASDDKDEKWGTIFLDSKRESTLSKLDAMTAASRQEQWNQRTQQDYLEKVRAKAIERAREILGEAYTERQKVLEDAEAEAGLIREEALNIKQSAETIRNEAQELKHSVQAELDKAMHMQSTAQEDGFQAGLEQAQGELDKFRQAMGASVAGVLNAIEGQCLNIFAHWRNELVELLKVCVEKSTGLALDERYNKILEQLVIEAVRNLDDRRHVTLHVHPDDEAVMSDIFAAAKEKMPDLGQWGINPDPNLELGGLVAESASGTVDSRLELFRDMVGNILEHLMLPESELEPAALEFVQKISELEKANIAQIVPPMPESVVPESTTPDLPESMPEPIPELAQEQTPEPINHEAEPNLEQTQEQIQEQIQEVTEPNSEQLEQVAPMPAPILDEVSDAKAIVEDVLPPENEMLNFEQQNMADNEADSQYVNALLQELEPNLAQETQLEDNIEQLPEQLPEQAPKQAFGTAARAIDPLPDQDLDPIKAQELSRLELEEELLPIPDDTKDNI